MRNYLIFLLIPLALSACVSKKKYLALEGRLQAETTLREDKESDIVDLQRQVAALKVDTARLGQDLRATRAKYDNLLDQSFNKAELLSKELAAKTQELRSKEQILQDREQKVQELSAIIQRQDSITQALLAKVQDALVNFRADELSVEMKNGKVYVSLSDQLLFQSGSAEVNSKGREALLKVAEVLKKNPDIGVVIEGHTDNVPIQTSRFKDNWDLSVLRATSVVRILVWSGEIQPERLRPSGRSQYIPVASNDTKESRAKNRRTEIILEPNLEELFTLLQKK
jgi:chemotaxis protein MotB